jgi:hypothetical protein
MATKALPSGRSDQKCLKSDSVSIVPPDFVETRKSAWSRSMAVSTLRTGARVGGVEHVQARPAGLLAERAADDLGGQ